MAYEHREGQGALFKNAKKKGENSPDMTGNCMVGGVVYRIAGWTKEAKNGQKFLSLKLTLTDEQDQRTDESAVPF